ncbi:hypothetical protein Tco_1163132 [Tanacetum coccineum]
MSFLTTPETCHILQEVITCTLKPNSTILLHVTYSLTSLALLRTRSMMIICPDSFWSPVLLLVMIVVSVAVIVVVVVIVAVVPYPELIARPENHEHTSQSSSFQWAPIQDTSRPAHRNDCCMPRCHLLLESEFKALVPSFGFQLLGSIQWSS